jgi:hypothetical protein
MDLSLADVSFIHAKLGSEKDSIKRRNGATPSAVSSKSSASAKQKEKSKNSNKSKNGASSNKRNKKKSKKEIEEEAAGYLIHQRKILLTNYMTCCKKLKVDPDAQLVYQMEVHESVEWSKEEREAASGALEAIVSDGACLGPGNTRALCCGISGRWLSTTAESLTFAPRYELLLHLAINNGAIGTTGARAVSAMLATSTCTLKTLRLCSQNNIGAAGCRALGNALSFSGGNRSLVELFLDGDTSIGDEGVAELCYRLELNSSLKVLSLASCKIESRGAAAVADMLKSIRSGVQYLSLECNTLGATGIVALCSRGLNNVLQVLNIASTGVQEKDSLLAVDALGAAIRQASNLQAVDFNLNHFTPASAEKMSLLLAKARRDGSKLDEFIVTTILDHQHYKNLHLDPSLISSWTSRMKESTNAFRRTPTPSPFGSEINTTILRK